MIDLIELAQQLSKTGTVRVIYNNKTDALVARNKYPNKNIYFTFYISQEEVFGMLSDYTIWTYPPCYLAFEALVAKRTKHLVITNVNNS